MFIVKNLRAHMALDSRGWPTVACELELNDGSLGYSMTPSGASTGQFEAHELRDQDNQYYHGKGVNKALLNINEQMKSLICNQSFENQLAFDQFLRSLDNTPQLQKFGANAILPISKAFFKATAVSSKQHLFQNIDSNQTFFCPVPLLNVINGGAHASNNLFIQEFMLVPYGFDTFSESIRAGVEIYQNIKKFLISKGLNTSVGDEGGFAPNFKNDNEVLDILMDMISKSGYCPKSQVGIALDVAASEFYLNGIYKTDSEYTSSDWVNYLINLKNNYPILSIEDPCADIDHKGWAQINQAIGHDCMIVGDDLLVTQVDRLEHASNDKLVNAVLIKPNQVGTISDTVSTIQYAHAHQINVITSHRSGDTEDVFIADFAIGTHAQFIKSGAPCRSERLSKYNRILRIESEFGLSLYEYDIKV